MALCNFATSRTTYSTKQQNQKLFHLTKLYKQRIRKDFLWRSVEYFRIFNVTKIAFNDIVHRLLRYFINRQDIKAIPYCWSYLIRISAANLIQTIIMTVLCNRTASNEGVCNWNKTEMAFRSRILTISRIAGCRPPKIAPFLVSKPPTHGSLGPPESTSQTASRSVQPF